MTLFFYIVIGIITFVAFLHAWSKKDYDVSRTIMINRPKAEVYGYIRQLQKQTLWMPWFLNDPNTVVKFKGEDGKEGAAAYWKGSNRVEAIQKLTKVKDGKVLESQLLFLRPYKSMSLNYMAVKEVEADRTKMVWGLKGIHRFPASVLMLFYSMDRALGKDFETGLYNLKTILERK
ncbi:SRPBCC family protein [Salinimicrobium gaetbulicola]|uniref:SRPBCC family protein n=1 Tax=Salinimicrobium gaetbulicola TaxID=999702 RepID=A0ABW3ICB6_9FLAO